jgi:hypothetical protein
VLVLLNELLAHARDCQHKAAPPKQPQQPRRGRPSKKDAAKQKKAARRAAAEGQPASPIRKPPVRLSSQGSPTRHNPCTFEGRASGCLVCRRDIVTGCANPACGHLHDGECWAKWHSKDPTIDRSAFKTKKKQPVVAQPKPMKPL